MDVQYLYSTIMKNPTEHKGMEGAHLTEAQKTHPLFSICSSHSLDEVLSLIRDTTDSRVIIHLKFPN